MNENEIAWGLAISELNLVKRIESDGYARVTADELNRYRQARLMAKIDHHSQIPNPLAENGWTVIGISNYEYAVGPFKIFQEVPTPVPGIEVTYRKPRLDLDTLSPSDISSEADAILLAHASGIIDEFIGEPTTFTTFGRRRSDSFEFTVENSITNSTILSVNGTQIEIDGGFEGENTFTLIECKNHTCTDFNLRQLYFPYRYWADKISKSVVSVFMTYSNGIFDLYKYEFTFPDDINSAELVEHARYTTIETSISLQALFGFAKHTLKLESAGVPFPQADNFELLLQVVDFCGRQGSTKHEIAQNFEFDIRQADYYSSAAKFLGLLSDTGGTLRATAKAQDIFTSEGNARYSKLAACVLSVTPIAETFLHGNRYVRADFDFSYAKSALSRSTFGESLSEATLERRARTIVNWCKWLDSIVRN